MGQFDPTKGKQALEIRSSLSERRSLTDPILPGECSDLVQAHSLLWAKAHGKLLTKNKKTKNKTVIKSWDGYCVIKEMVEILAEKNIMYIWRMLILCLFNVYCTSELPESMTLDFECGVQLKMGFAAEFSNVLVIYTNIVKKPEEMSSCQAHLINLSVSIWMMFQYIPSKRNEMKSCFMCLVCLSVKV